MGSKERKENTDQKSGELKNMLTFKQWCEKNGRRWQVVDDFDEFMKNADDYQRYRSTYEEKKDGR